MARKPKLEPTFEPANALIGIASDLPLVRLVHFINNNTPLQLSCTDDLEVFFEKLDDLVPFRFFYCRDEEYRSDICLVPNLADGLLLLPKIKEFNFLLVVRGAMPPERVKQITAAVKRISGVRIATPVKQETIPELGPVLQEIEIHLIGITNQLANAKLRIMPRSEDQ